MKNRLPIVISIAALVVALLGTTGVAQAVQNAASFAANAGKLRGFAPSKTSRKNTVVVRGKNGKIDARSIPAQARGARGTQGPAGPTGPQGAPGQGGSPDTPAQILSKLQTVDGSGSDLDADRLDGLSSANFVPLQTADTGSPAVPVRFYSYFMTTTSTNRLDFGQMALEAAGVAGQFKICGDTGGSGLLNWVLYLNGTRSTGTVAGNACTAAFDAGAGGDFQVTMRRSIVFGVHSGDSTTNENYNVYGFGQL